MRALSYNLSVFVIMSSILLKNYIKIIKIHFEKDNAVKKSCKIFNIFGPHNHLCETVTGNIVHEFTSGGPEARRTTTVI